MIYNFIFLQLRADAEQFGHFFAVVKNDSVGLNLGAIGERAAEVTGAFRVVYGIGFLDV